MQNTAALNASSKDQIKMANVLITVKIMPESTETDLDEIIESVKRILDEAECSFARAEKENVAFGLMSLKIIFMMDEKRSTELDGLEGKLSNINGVMSVNVEDVRRAIG